MGKVIFLGVEGTGKTTLAMALLKAFELHRDEGWYLAPATRDAFRFSKCIPDDFRAGEFPAQTAANKMLSWTVEYKGERLHELSILDYPGEVFRLAFLDPSENDGVGGVTTEKITAHKDDIDQMLETVEAADQAFVLLNLQDTVDLRLHPENLDAIWATNECLKFLRDLPSCPSHALLLTQIDRYMDDGEIPDDFVPENLDLIEHDNPDIPVYVTSVLASPGSVGSIDALVMKILYSCAGEQMAKRDSEYIEQLDVCRQELIDQASGILQADDTLSHYWIVKDAIKKTEAALQTLETARMSLPWLFNPNAQGMLVVDEEIDDAHRLIECMSLASANNRESVRNAVQGFVPKSESVTAIVASFNNIISSCDELARQAVERKRQEEELARLAVERKRQEAEDSARAREQVLQEEAEQRARQATQDLLVKSHEAKNRLSQILRTALSVDKATRTVVFCATTVEESLATLKTCVQLHEDFDRTCKYLSMCMAKTMEGQDCFLSEKEARDITALRAVFIAFKRRKAIFVGDAAFVEMMNHLQSLNLETDFGRDILAVWQGVLNFGKRKGVFGWFGTGFFAFILIASIIFIICAASQ